MAAMLLELSDEQVAFRSVVRDFAEKEVAPFAEEWDREHTFPVDTITAMGEPSVSPCRTPERSCTVSVSIFIRPPRP